MKVLICFIIIFLGCGQKENFSPSKENSSSSMGTLDLAVELPEDSLSNKNYLEEIQKYIVSFEGDGWRKEKIIYRKEVSSELFTDIPRERNVKVTVEAIDSKNKTILSGSQSFDFTAAKVGKIPLKEKVE